METHSTLKRLTLALLGLLLAACSIAQAEGVPPTPEVSHGPALQPAVVDYVGVEIGVGSPIPVQVIIDASFPDPCAQLVSVQQSWAGAEFQISVTTSAADAACQSPVGPLPFRFAVPLNAAGLEPGNYTVTVNGESTTFAYPPAASQ
jgi:hypothetical protein